MVRYTRLWETMEKRGMSQPDPVSWDQRGTDAQAEAEHERFHPDH